jgi:hypothetical protein
VIKVLVLTTLLALAACERHPPPLNEPASNAPVWNLNVDQMQGTNDLRHLPTVGDR